MVITLFRIVRFDINTEIIEGLCCIETDNYFLLRGNGTGTLDKTTEYKITFIPLVGIEGTLGLTSISTTDAVNKNGTQLKINMN